MASTRNFVRSNISVQRCYTYDAHRALPIMVSFCTSIC